MTEPTLESLVKRIEAIEKQLAEQPSSAPLRKKDWRRVVGIFDNSEFAQQMIAEMEARREAERQAAREGQPE